MAVINIPKQYKDAVKKILGNIHNQIQTVHAGMIDERNNIKHEIGKFRSFLNHGRASHNEFNKAIEHIQTAEDLYKDFEKYDEEIHKMGAKAVREAKRKHQLPNWNQLSREEQNKFKHNTNYARYIYVNKTRRGLYHTIERHRHEFEKIKKEITTADETERTIISEMASVEHELTELEKSVDEGLNLIKYIDDETGQMAQLMQHPENKDKTIIQYEPIDTDDVARSIHVIFTLFNTLSKAYNLLAQRNTVIKQIYARTKQIESYLRNLKILETRLKASLKHAKETADNIGKIVKNTESGHVNVSDQDFANGSRSSVNDSD